MDTKSDIKSFSIVIVIVIVIKFNTLIYNLWIFNLIIIQIFYWFDELLTQILHYLLQQ